MPDSIILMGGFSKIFLEFCYVCISEFAHLKNNIEFAESYVVRSILCARGLIIIISHALAEVSLERLQASVLYPISRNSSVEYREGREGEGASGIASKRRGTLNGHEWVCDAQCSTHD